MSMSMPLDVAVAIAGAVSRSRRLRAPLELEATAAEIARRHRSAGYSYEDVAETLAEESSREGVPVLAPAGAH